MVAKRLPGREDDRADVNRVHQVAGYHYLQQKVHGHSPQRHRSAGVNGEVNRPKRRRQSGQRVGRITQELAVWKATAVSRIATAGGIAACGRSELS